MLSAVLRTVYWLVCWQRSSPLKQFDTLLLAVRFPCLYAVWHYSLSIPLSLYILLTASCGILMTLSSLFQIQMMTYVQLLKPNHQIGKVISCVNCICMCANPVGSFLYGIVFEHIGTQTFLLFYIASCVVFSVVVIFGNFLPV